MNVERTIKLKLELFDESKETLRQTMVLSNQVFNEIADIGKSDIGRLTVTQPYIACDEVEARKGIDTEHSDNAPHFKSAE